MRLPSVAKARTEPLIWTPSLSLPPHQWCRMFGVRGSLVVRCLSRSVVAVVYFSWPPAGRSGWPPTGISSRAGRAAETQVMLSDTASDDLVTMDAWEPERPSASKSAFARGFVCRHVQDFANPRASPGGTPEPHEADLVATLVRETFEENQIRVEATAYLGYQEVHRPGRPQYAQVRMAG
jgi:NUDIX domain